MVDININQYIQNELTEDQLLSLVAAESVPPNEVFMTPDEVVEDLKFSLPLGSVFPAAVKLDSAAVRLLNGDSLLQEGVYYQFANWIKARIAVDAANVPTATIAQYATEMATYGQCGKFVINDTGSTQTSGAYSVPANSIKLPTITQFIASNNGGHTIGLAELDMFKEHSHNYRLSNTSLTDEDNPYSASWVNNKAMSVLSTEGTLSTGGAETKPKNIRYPYYIVVAKGVEPQILIDTNEILADLQTKADKDASNLTSGNVDSFQGVLGYERVETVYHMNGGSTLDWGFTAGINSLTSGSIIPPVNLSNYKRLRIYYQTWMKPTYPVINGGTNNVIELDLSYNLKSIDGNYCAQSTNKHTYRSDHSSINPLGFDTLFEYGLTNNSFVALFFFEAALEPLTYSYVYKIEGVY